MAISFQAKIYESHSARAIDVTRMCFQSLASHPDDAIRLLYSGSNPMLVGKVIEHMELPLAGAQDKNVSANTQDDPYHWDDLLWAVETIREDLTALYGFADTPEEYVTIRDVASNLRTPPLVVRRWIKTYPIIARRVAGHWRIWPEFYIGLINGLSLTDAAARCEVRWG